jgi:hypothetical protein
MTLALPINPIKSNSKVVNHPVFNFESTTSSESNTITSPPYTTEKILRNNTTNQH